MIIVFSMFLILYELNSAEFNDEMRETKEEKQIFKRNKLVDLGVRERRYE